MSRVVKVKNTGALKTWNGVAVASGTYYTIPDSEISDWKLDDIVFSDVSSGRLIVNDGTDDFSSTATGWGWLSGSVPADVLLKIRDETTGVLSDFAITERPVCSDGKPRVLASHKPVIEGRESYNYFTSKGDDVASTSVGEGNWLNLVATSGVLTTSVDLRFLSEVESIQEVIYVYGGSISWEGAGWGDHLCFDLRTNPTPVVPRVVASGLSLPVDYSLDGDRIYYAGPDGGDYALGGNPVWVPTFSGTGYWNLNTNPLAAVPAPDGDGDYDWRTTDHFAGSYLHNVALYGDNFNLGIIDASEAAPLPYGYYMRIEIHNESNTDWKLWGFLRLYRERLM